MLVLAGFEKLPEKAFCLGLQSSILQALFAEGGWK